MTDEDMEIIKAITRLEVACITMKTAIVEGRRGMLNRARSLLSEAITEVEEKALVVD